ncbi:inositol monophosphatase [Dysgonomonas sp. Marseille-P4677]|uniref:inositol monophosphatase family protein n=1 Tax=Dysgonomonas sp. Marseille-P4677 TaxID=2364790 RepID=UPI0019132C54|nr:inositol monophosphatase family protein [Dysgonomonas sp. Marseille-P4677]MBK5720087.1 inositol monophosphatase [Dysgonomonas sp. Marseille-P4677]
MNLESLTSEVCKIAKAGGKFLSEERKVFNRNKVEEKNAHDYVSYVDKETEKLLVQKLSELLPEAGFITEEETVEFTENEYYWVIDPLDGTTNFIHDNAPYCVSIALTYKSEPIIGVVYEVCRDECFYAWKDGMAHMNGNQISVSNTGDMNKALVGLDLPYNDKQYKPVINHLMNTLYGNVSSIRINGSAAMSLCYVAIGRFDLWVEAYIKPWDFMAGALIVQEAGGMITDYRGSDNFVKSHHIVATNNLLHENTLSLVTPFIDSL